MTIWILEVARVAAVEGCLRMLDDAGASLFGLLHDGIDFCWRGDVVRKSELRGAGVLQWHAGYRPQCSCVATTPSLRPDSRLKNATEPFSNS